MRSLVAKRKHHSLKQPREGGRFVKQRTNGKNKIDAASTLAAPIGVSLQRILRPQAAFRWLMPNLAAITPQYIEQTLTGAMGGNHVQQWALFDLMLKSWPELLQCYDELVTGVTRKKLIYEPYCEEDEEPTPNALDRMKLVSTALRRMEPDPTRDENALEGTIKDVLDAWFRGLSVNEIIWQTIEDPQIGMLAAPQSTFSVDPTNYAFSSSGVLGLRQNKENTGNAVWPYVTTSTQPQPDKLQAFPENKFLIAMHKASAGSVLTGGLLRPLAWWWCAANFSSDWLLNLAQVFGLPFRWANYDANAPQATIDAICNMLQNMGSAGWAAFPVGTTLEMINASGQQGSDHSPQGELLDRADRYARSLILGQTMTGSHGTTGKGGGQAFGTVEQDVKGDRVDAAGRFAENVINGQLIKFVLLLNYGDTDEAPRVKFLEDEVADLAEAQRDKTLADAGMEIGVDYLRKKYDIPAPAEGEETIGGAKPDPFGGGFGGQSPFDQQPPNDNQDVAAGDMPGHEFRGNQYTKGGELLDILNPPKNASVSETGVYHNGLGYKRVNGKWVRAGIGSMAPDMPVNDERLIQILNEEYIVAQQRQYVKAGDAPGHAFHGNQWTRVEGPGAALGMGNRQEYLQTGKGRYQIHALAGKYRGQFALNLVRSDGTPEHIGIFRNISEAKTAARNHMLTIPKDTSGFPSLLQSEEDKRRKMLNAQLHTKLLELNEIKDDAVFARELSQLAEETQHAKGN